jgi:hypothetical protein
MRGRESSDLQVQREWEGEGLLTASTGHDNRGGMEKKLKFMH